MKWTKRKKWIGLVAGLVAVLLLFYQIYRIKNPIIYKDREKVVICLDKGAKWNQKHSDKNDIILHNCDSWLIEYNGEKDTILYRNIDGIIVERFLKTGIEEKLDMEEIKKSIISDSDIYARNLKYVPDGQEISFSYKGNIYAYNLDEKQVRKIAECKNTEHSDWYDIYQWKNQEEIFITKDSSYWEVCLYNSAEQVTQSVQDGIRSFIIGNDQQRLYAIQYYCVPNAFGFSTRNQIVEINVQNGESIVLQEFDSDNLILQCVDDKYLYYVERHSSQKYSKLYCLNLESGKTKCIYKTDKEIVGIIER